MKLQLPAQKSLGIANESLAEIIDLPKALPENYYKPGWYTYDISSKTWRKIKEEQDDLKTKKFHAAAEALEPITANLREISPQFRSAHLHRLDVTQATAKPGEAFNRCFNVWHTDPKKEAEVEAIFAFTQPTKFLHGEYDDPTLPDNARQDDVRVRLNEIGDERLKNEFGLNIAAADDREVMMLGDNVWHASPTNTLLEKVTRTVVIATFRH